MIKIIDNAGGIPSATSERIFESYFSTKDEKYGIGRGLYISKTIIQQNLGGELIHYNDKQGAVFLITWNL